MIKEKEQCIKFMELKAEEIAKYDDYLYFSELDRQLIKNMEDRRFMGAWDRIKLNIHRDLVLGVSAKSCIFCQYYVDCDECQYSAESIFCDNNYTLGWHYILTIEFYKKILKEALKI